MISDYLKILPMLALLISVEASGSTAQLPQTGQATCYDSIGTVITCTGTGQDGDIKAGVAWPASRFTDNTNGTVTDKLTGLIWMKNANCTETLGGVAHPNGYLLWMEALAWSNALATSSCGLSDNSVSGDWRLPNRKELLSLIDFQNLNPSLPTGHPFSNVQSCYWSSSSLAAAPYFAWVAYMEQPTLTVFPKSEGDCNVWAVRGGQ